MAIEQHGIHVTRGADYGLQGFDRRPATPRSCAQRGEQSLAAKPQLLTRYAAVTLRQRISRRMAEGTALGMALESLTAANLAYLPIERAG
jgi:hypothetical protein